MIKFWYKVVPVIAGFTYKWKVIEYWGTERAYSYKVLRYFKTKEEAERFANKKEREQKNKLSRKRGCASCKLWSFKEGCLLGEPQWKDNNCPNWKPKGVEK